MAAFHLTLNKISHVITHVITHVTHVITLNKISHVSEVSVTGGTSKDQWGLVLAASTQLFKRYDGGREGKIRRGSAV